MVFAFLAGVQVIIVTGHGWIPSEWQVVVKSIALGLMVIGMFIVICIVEFFKPIINGQHKTEQEN